MTGSRGELARRSGVCVLPLHGRLHRVLRNTLFCGPLLACAAGNGRAQALPNSPGALIFFHAAGSPASSSSPDPGDGFAPQTTSPTRKARCAPPIATTSPEANVSSQAAARASRNCLVENPVQSVVSKPVIPLTPMGKAQLAVRDFDDPFNFGTIVGYSGIAVASNPRSAFGPGFAGWGRLTGYSLLEDAQGEFVGTFLIPSLVHEDPRYHRLPQAPFKRRIFHAIAHTVVSQHDDGTRMINYATLINYPISAELANLYVPGIQDNGPDTARRIAIGLASDPAGTLVAEFLPDVARHIHVHIIFVQEIVNQVVTGGTAPNVQ